MVAEPVREDDVDDTVIRARDGGVPVDRTAAATDDTVIRRPRGPARGAPDDDTVIRPRPVVHDDAAADDTVIRPGRGAPVSVAPQGGGRPDPTAVPDVPAVPRTRTPSVRIGGQVLGLDQPLVIGRRPAAPRVVRGPAPRLVTVPSPSGQVSSSHLAVHAEGEAAVVEDLRSTNGTVVRPAGAAPFRMASGASIVVLTGTVVEIGDGNVIEVLSPHLRIAPPDGFPGVPVVPVSDVPTGTPPTPRERS